MAWIAPRVLQRSSLSNLVGKVIGVSNSSPSVLVNPTVIFPSLHMRRPFCIGSVGGATDFPEATLPPGEKHRMNLH